MYLDRIDIHYAFQRCVYFRLTRYVNTCYNANNQLAGKISQTRVNERSLFARYHGLIGLFFFKNNYTCRVGWIYAAYSGNSKLVISSVNAENHYRGRELLKRIGSFFFFFFYADSCNFVAPPWPHTMRIRCIGEYHTLKFFFENDASRTSFFLYSFLWPEFAPVTFDACKRHESIYLALLFFLGNNITYLRISISLKSRALFTYFSANSSFIYFLTDKKSIVLNEESYFFLPPASFKYPVFPSSNQHAKRRDLIRSRSR